MEFKQSLKQRIVIVFALMSALVGGVFASGIVATVHVVERKLTTIGLNGNLHRLLVSDSVETWTHQPQKDEWFFVQGGVGDLAMDDKLARLEPGFQEITRDHHPYYAMVQEVDGRKYVLLRDRESFDKRQHLLFTVAIIGFVLCILLAMLLGWLLARKVMAPVVKLAGQVRHRDQSLEMAPALAPHYARDEVGELAASFDGALGRLRDALRRERLFTADVSHELRTPLMVLASSCELLQVDPSVDSRAQAQVTRMARASLGMSQLIETFLILARAQGDGSGRLCSLAAVGDEVVEIWRQPIEEKGLSFAYLADSRCTTLYNHTFLYSVMSNLVRNAWHYTDSGFIRLTLLDDGFTVQDSGIGIPEEKRQAMFQPFVRGDEQRGEGLGLGLSLVQRICQNQGWSVKLSGLEPHGCCFTVELAALVD
ncbi:HAMP domain-containing sensor histidine kinase [Pseudomonas sp. HR96]|uniref:sensor histidine kinase n=1 Tax=Pseudomonas sp. HR96 TaxID=1027966 RepID=UPI002A761DDE|nr:HAMP domain-containing sensor histidine kinase [Pseudomonas sp. HR96]WPP01560.1 HAMP domain-containing sensor histidine kinase [Pseudomonas sp. HR96]